METAELGERMKRLLIALAALVGVYAFWLYLSSRNGPPCYGAGM